jgi:hypothetical protein
MYQAMWRFSSVMFTIASLCYCQKPDAVKREVTPPIVVKVEMPSQNPWERVGELAIPTALGALLTLLGVWLTNRTNANTNASNRAHELQRLDQQRRWELRRDVLMGVSSALVQSVKALAARA